MMLTIEGTVSLNIVKDQLDESLRLAETSLEQYLDEPEDEHRLRTCIEELVQIKGVLKLIELHGAAMLSEEMLELINMLLVGQSKERDHSLGILSGALMVLSKYLEYVQLQQYSLPVLLVPVINEVRSTLRKPLLAESMFFEVPVSVVQPPVLGGEPANPAQLMQTGHRLRHLYQVGMLGVFKGDRVDMHARMMLRALTRIEALSGSVPMARLWWLGRGVLESVADKQLSVNNVRKSLLGAIDRQFRSVLSGGEAALMGEPPQALLKECLFLTALATRPGPVAHQIQSAFAIPKDRITDHRLQAQRDVMFGPGRSVMHAVVDALREELTFIKEQLDLGARGGQEDEGGFSRIAEALGRISNTLKMLGQEEVAAALAAKLSVISSWDHSSIDGESAEFQAVADVLLYVENSVAMLLPRLQGALSSADDEMTELRSRGISVSLLDDARKVVVEESRAGLSLAKRAIASFLESEGDGMHLSNVPVTLTSVWGGLIFLQMKRAAEVMRACEDFISSKLLNERTKPDAHTMETLADAITSIDYYLESLEDNKPIGDGILEVAEESMQELGFPVKAA
ncbi:Conserved hypothetical protein [gamma proteobacterium HdN1]|nr:Conserved hypothetical protein [gamma proteobacterium HdN1]